jgi:DNA-dependent RNA polymerase
MYNETLLAQQLERERQALKDGIRQSNNDLQRDKQRCYFSHTDFGKSYRERKFPKLQGAFKRAVDNHLGPSDNASPGKAERVTALNAFVGAIKCLKEKNRVDVYNQDSTVGDLCDLLAHITLTAMLDNAAMSYSGHKNGKGNLNDPRFRFKLTLDELEEELGKEIFFQLRLFLLAQVMKGWVDGVSKYASQKGLANLKYHHYNCNRMVDKLIAETQLNYEKVEDEKAAEVDNPTFTPEEATRIRKAKRAADALMAFDASWKAFKEHKIFGQWCISIALDGANLDAFTIEKGVVTTYARTSGNKVKRRNGKPSIITQFCQFLTITEKYKELWRVVQVEDDDAIDELAPERKLSLSLRIPMIIPPAAMTAGSKGGWLGDSSALLESFKGSTELSEEHLEFFNNQASTAFRINPWMLKLLERLDKGSGADPIKLGSYKNHVKQRVPEPSQRLLGQYKPTPDWDNLTRDEQRQIIIRQVGEDAWQKVKIAATDEHTRQEDLKRKGAASRQALALARKLVKDERIYFPIRPDFRNRVVVRTAHVHYQGTDHGKALIKFADSVPKDDETERWLLINMANHYGGKMDKKSFQERVNEMQKRSLEITAVATMLDEGGCFQTGLDILKQVDFQGGKCFQFATTCREYWELYIAKKKTTTDLIVTVDCSTSGQQIASVWLRIPELAMKTNVKNNGSGKPSDLYGEVFIRMLWLMQQDGKVFNKDTDTKLKELGFGRAICKAAIQGAQYGSSTKSQIGAIIEKIADLEAKDQVHFIRTDEETAEGIEDEVGLFCTYFPKALEAVCQLGTLNEWFKKLASEVHTLKGEEIIIPTPIGSLSHIQYTPLKKRRIRTYHYGESKADRKTVVAEPNINPTEKDRKEQLATWKSSVCPNTTHAYDACLIAMALHDFPYPFTSCHDSLGCHASGRMDTLRDRLQQALLRIAKYDVFGEIMRANGVEELMDKPPIHQNWKTMEYDILNSEYFTG